MNSYTSLQLLYLLTASISNEHWHFPSIIVKDLINKLLERKAIADDIATSIFLISKKAKRAI